MHSGVYAQAWNRELTWNESVFPTWVCDAYYQQFAKDVSYHLHGRLANHMAMAADQVDRRRQETWASPCCLHADFFMLTVQKVVSAVPHKLC